MQSTRSGSEEKLASPRRNFAIPSVVLGLNALQVHTFESSQVGVIRMIYMRNPTQLFLFLSCNMQQPPKFLLVRMPVHLVISKMRCDIKKSQQLTIVLVTLTTHSSNSISRRVCSCLVRPSCGRLSRQPCISGFDCSRFIRYTKSMMFQNKTLKLLNSCDLIFVRWEDRIRFQQRPQG